MWLHDPDYIHKMQGSAVLLDQSLPVERQSIFFYGKQVGLVVKHSPANAGDTRDAGSIPGSGGSPGVGNGNLTQYSCLEKSMDRGAWWAAAQSMGLQRMEHSWAAEHTGSRNTQPEILRERIPPQQFQAPKRWKIRLIFPLEISWCGYHPNVARMEN